MKRSVRLARICSIRRLKEDQAAAEVAYARQKLAASRQLLSELERHRDDYLKLLMQVQDRKLAAMQWRQQREFISTLDSVINRQEGQIAQADQQLGLLHGFWRQQHSGRRALDKLVQRTEVQEQRNEDRREQRLQDDLSSVRFTKQLGGSL